MPLVPTLISFSPGTTILSADINSNFTALRDVANTYTVLTDVAKTITVTHTISADPGLILTAAVSRIVGGATSFSIRNAANNADNLVLTDAGAATFRSTVGGITTLTATTLAGTLSTAAQPNVTSLGTLTSLVLSGTISGVTTLTATTLAGTLSTASQPNVTSMAALAVTAAQVTSLTFADARIAQSNVTQHQAALSIAETQIPDGTLLARVAAAETWAAKQTFSGGTNRHNVDDGSASVAGVAGVVVSTSAASGDYPEGTLWCKV